MKAMSDFEKKILNYMKGVWDESGFCNLRFVLEKNISDFALVIEGKSVTLITSEIDLVAKTEGMLFDPTQIKLSAKLGLLLEVKALIVYLDQNGLIMTNKSKNMLPPKVIYSNGVREDSPHKMTVFEEYALFIVDYYFCRIFPTQDMLDYIKNKFKTADDLLIEKQDKRYQYEKEALEERVKIEHRNSKLSLWIALGIGIASLLSSTIFGILNYTSNKVVKVQIENLIPTIQTFEKSKLNKSDSLNTKSPEKIIKGVSK